MHVRAIRIQIFILVPEMDILLRFVFPKLAARPLLVAWLTTMFLTLPVWPGSARLKERPLVIPYPGGNMYMEQGITATVGAGIHKARNSGDDHLWDFTDKMFQWQGEGSFYYTPKISGGASAIIVAGESTPKTSQVENRYTAFIRYHFHSNRIAAYIGPFVGLYNLDFSEDTKSESTPDVSDTKGQQIHDMKTAILDYGVSVGTGYKPSKYVGFTVGGRVEQAWNGGLGDSMAETLFKLYPGMSVDIVSLFPGVVDQAKGFFFHVGVQWAYVIDAEDPKREFEEVFVLGGSVGF